MRPYGTLIGALMRRLDVIIRKTYEQNLITFSDKDRANARAAWDIYMSEINGAGLRGEFDYYPRDVDKLLKRPQEHCSKIDRLKARVRQFEEFIELLEKLGDRTAVELNPMWNSSDDTAETITRTLDPQAVPAYRAFHAALVAYLDELSKKNSDWNKIAEFARQVAYTVNPEKWQKAGAPASGRRVTDFGTRWFLEAILAKPKEPTD